MRQKTNLQMSELVWSLRKASRENKAPIWLAISRAIGKSRRNIAQVNISRIARLTKDGETVAVPGKVLGTGMISHKLTVGALSFSANAKEKITNAGGICTTLVDLADKNPKGTHVKIMR